MWGRQRQRNSKEARKVGGYGGGKCVLGVNEVRGEGEVPVWAVRVDDVYVVKLEALERGCGAFEDMFSR